MEKGNSQQLAMLLENNRSSTILKETKQIFCYHYTQKGFKRVKRCYDAVRKLYFGKWSGYKACNTEYHDFNHIKDVYIATIRLIDGQNLSGTVMPEEIAVHTLMAAILHDTGYIQEDWDEMGTGAKYTSDHVQRSIEFAQRHCYDLDIFFEETGPICRIIESTEYKEDFSKIPYISDCEKKAGTILGTADLIGQMSSRIYLEKLLFLYYEFREAGIPGFDTEFDVIRKTVDFYDMTKTRLDTSFNRIYEYAENHFRERYNIPHNLYMDAIDNSIDYLKEIIKDDTTNFRHKLKRADWVHEDRSDQNQ